MASIITTWGELGKNEFNGSVSLTVSTAAVRTGVYAYRGNNQFAVQTFAGNLTELYLRLAFRIDDAGGSPGTLIAFRDEDAAAQISVAYNAATQSVSLVRGATVIATGAAVITLATWYVLELHLVLSDTVGVAAGKLNGVTDFAFSGDTVATAKPSVRSMVIGNGGWVAFFDDIAINDTTGSYQNSWIGTGGVYLLRPTSDGVTTDWAPSTGSDDYACVDEVPANTTDWVQAQAAGTLDLYGLGDLPADVKTVDMVETVWQAALSEAGWNELKGVIRHGGTNYVDGAGQPVTSVKENYVLYKGAPLYVDPGDASAWTPADVNALEAGVQVA
jgi:hypothetical protein